jgi:hypothetical protein
MAVPMATSKVVRLAAEASREERLLGHLCAMR